MERTAVSSSTVASVGYDSASQTLEVEFMNGSVYQYFDVPQGVFDSLLTTDSPGGFMHEQIRGFYRFARA
jgi:hypothetical protein